MASPPREFAFNIYHEPARNWVNKRKKKCERFFILIGFLLPCSLFNYNWRLQFRVIYLKIHVIFDIDTAGMNKTRFKRGKFLIRSYNRVLCLAFLFFPDARREFYFSNMPD